MKRMTSWLLAIIMIVSCITPVMAMPEDGTKAAMTMSDEGMKLLKAEEGFNQYPYWDKKQYTVGYGTRCPDDKVEYYTKYGITHEEAELLLKDYMTDMENALNRYMVKYNVVLTQNQYDAIALFSYNVGHSWTTNTSGVIFEAITYGATGNELIRAFGLWCKSNGKIQDYLLRRRMSEANLYLNGVYSKEPPESYGYVIYDGNGGTTDRTSQVFDSALPAPILCNATHNGYAFAGWFTEKVGGRKVTKLDASVKGLTLYAQWLRLDEMANWTDIVDVTVTVSSDELCFSMGPGANYGLTGKAVKKGDALVVTETVKSGEVLWGRTVKGWVSLNDTDFDAVYEALPPEAFLPTEPEVTEPEVTEPEVTEPEITEPEVTEPEVTEPEITEPEVTEPEVTEPEVTEPEITEPPVTKWEGEVTASSLNIRAEANASAAKVGYYVRGAKVTILERKTVGSMEWGRTDKGWISLSYVDIQESVTPPAPTEPQPTEPPQSTQTGKVTASQLNIRAEAGTDGRWLGYYVRGTKVTILETKRIGSVEWGRTDKGWISLQYVQLDALVPEVVVKTVTADVLRVRSGPGTSYAVAARLNKGTKVTILETKTVGDMLWGRIDQGWISMDYVK